MTFKVAQVIHVMLLQMIHKENFFFTFRHEIKAVRATCCVRGLLSSFGRFGTKIAIFVSIVSYVLLEDDITAEKVSLGIS